MYPCPSFRILRWEKIQNSVGVAQFIVTDHWRAILLGKGSFTTTFFKSINKINSAMLIHHGAPCPPFISCRLKDVARNQMRRRSATNFTSEMVELKLIVSLILILIVCCQTTANERMLCYLLFLFRNKLFPDFVWQWENWFCSGGCGTSFSLQNKLVIHACRSTDEMMKHHYIASSSLWVGIHLIHHLPSYSVNLFQTFPKTSYSFLHSISIFRMKNTGRFKRSPSSLGGTITNRTMDR